MASHLGPRPEQANIVNTNHEEEYGIDSSPSKPAIDDKDLIKESVQAEVHDLEGDGSGIEDYNEKEKYGLLEEKKEITATEAFASNVDGDQSPCRFYMHRVLIGFCSC